MLLKLYYFLASHVVVILQSFKKVLHWVDQGGLFGSDQLNAGKPFGKHLYLSLAWVGTCGVEIVNNKV